MTFRHPPRLTELEDEAFSDDDPHANRDGVTALLNRSIRRAGALAAKAAKLNKESVTRTKASPILPPFATDFGPQTLTEYLRAEVDKLKLERKSLSGKGKGKEKDILDPAISGVLHQSNTSTSSHGLLSPSATPILANRVDDRQSTLWLAARRSQRLARRSVPNREVSQGAADHQRTPQSRPAPPTSFLPDVSQQPSIHGDDALTTILNGTSPVRTSTFEEHTKNKRMAVRHTAQEDLNNPMGARSRQRRLSKGLLPSGTPTAVITNSSATTSGVPLMGTPQYDTQASPHIPSSKNELRDSVHCPGQEANDNRTIETPSDKPSHAFPNNQGSPQKSPCRKEAAQPRPKRHTPTVASFDYASLIPEVISYSEKEDFINQETLTSTTAHLSTNLENRTTEPSWVCTAPFYISLPARSGGHPGVTRTYATHAVENSDPSEKNVPTAAPEKHYPRIWKPSVVPGTSLESTTSTRPYAGRAINVLGHKSNFIQKFDVDIWAEVSRFLSTQDVRNLRLVNKCFARIIAPIQFRNVVVNFGQHFFDTNPGTFDINSEHLPDDSMFKNYGANINKFGISFEYDLQGLTRAKKKITSKVQDAWFGKFRWPTEQYPRFPELQAIEDLVDHNRPFLKEALECLTTVSELGLCIDSGHGWLEGPDISDMALFNRRTTNGSRVFGKTFETEDVWTTFARNEYFRWAQQNTINETTKALMTKLQNQEESPAREIRFLDELKIRDIESFRRQDEQHDYDPECHVGGSSVPGVNSSMNATGVFPNFAATHEAASHRRLATHNLKGGKRLPQWPLIFNGHNLTAEHGGHCTFIQNQTANPCTSPLQPGLLTEPQAEWLMETVWAQRAFLSSYTTAIVTHKENFTSIHTLRISKLSSGLLPSIEQAEFWKSLPGLKTLEILISPDWRKEHVAGYHPHGWQMFLHPLNAAQKFTSFLRKYIVHIEHLHSLSIGYVGGGEHAVGLFARNKHVMAAPIVESPRQWLFFQDDSDQGQNLPLVKFDHIRELKFQNCWFTPWMLQEFMRRSRDTSLHSLTLDSVSMSVYHKAKQVAPAWNVLGHLRCLHPREEWTREILPPGASWARVLDAITPGKTLLAHKYDAGLIDPGIHPMPQPKFRGHVQEIILNSCGYVTISVPYLRPTAYNQNAAVVWADPTMDDALRVRKARFSSSLGFPVVWDSSSAFGVRGPMPLQETTDILIPDRSGYEHSWLGNLTQCIHPIEKRVLEEAWQMTFGWPNNLERWAAVEDGQCEGGTGRFSGIIRKSDQQMEC
ncbi:hypothetical protein AYL99_00167 [Fonsecaea erecta]|uniref:F-box domain-containing protein n=1 Tax=Fonsecaea erecta TaxID=1367422 RepID=A0A178ZYU7_9EURO|nr:hypothetical protein AYL99_00167 [Fonsecaea erecta]OAP64195.1 hypothetical protein AYL99_00167 [Fonsecaea erecta]